MSLRRNLGSLIITVLVGSLTFMIATPKKVSKNKVRVTKTSSHPRLDEKEDLFI
ncbi:MAG: ABC-type uncharacterized transport system substrate-binding protein [Marinoscillum sp.]|jgi:ABC-type uncharacterized transport system substrate-binding protein